MKRFLFNLFLILTFFYESGNAQNQIASPQIVNYNSEDYLAGIQNWDITQDKNGLLYFGNKEGLLTFNGKYWNRYSLPNLTGIRSVKVDSQNRIYVGGEDEFGYFSPEKSGTLKYNSLIYLIPLKERKMAHVFNIAINNDEVFFRSLASIVHYKQGAVHLYKPDIQWDFLGGANDKVYAQSKGRGILLFKNGIWKPIGDGEVLKGIAITSVCSYNKDTVLFSTLKDGLFLLAGEKLLKMSTSIDNDLAADRLFNVTKVNADWIALGTASSGLIIIDKNGNVVQRYSSSEGLQNNNIRAAFIDHNGSMWLSLDDGIDMVAINSAIKYIHPDKNKQVTFAMKVFDDKLYIGSSNGLFYTSLEKRQTDLSLSKGSFSKIKTLNGQIWSIDEINNHLVIAHEDGLFEMSNNGINKLFSNYGVWMFQTVSNVYPTPYVLTGTYNGLQLVKFNNNKFSNATSIEGINESLRFIVYDNSTNILWASHPYHGIYKLQLSADLKRVVRQTIYTQKEGLPATLYNYVYRLHNRIVVATEKGIYEYNSKSNQFSPSTFFKPYFNEIPVIYLKEDNEGNVWFVTRGKEVGVVEIKEEKKGQVTYFPEIRGKIVGGFESIYPYNTENVFIGAARGVFHINYKRFKEQKKELKVVLGQVRLLGEKDSVIFGGYFMNNGRVIPKQEDEGPVLDHNQNFLHFEFSSTLFHELNNIEFSYFLEGLDKDWSVWSNKSEKDYTNLPPGFYTFKVKARNNSGSESDEVIYKFSVKPIWYRSVWSYFLYIVLIGALILRILKLQQKKYKKEQEKLSYLHQLELDRNEKEIVRLNYEKLEADVDFKNRELSTMTMHLVQRGKVLSKIKEVISTVIKNHDVSDSSPSFRHLIRLIREVEKSDEDWDNFAMHFNNVNTDFFNKLKDNFPDLTPNELKLCAYLKMNLSSKEIAQLMNITIKAVEVGRYRLRKKLQLQSETNLYDFLMQLSRKSS